MRRHSLASRLRPALAPVLALLLGLAGCSTADKVLFQSLTAEQPEPPPTDTERKAAVEQPPPLSAGYFRSAPVTMPRAGAGTVGDALRGLGEQMQALSRDVDDRNLELQRIRAALAARTEDYLVDRLALLDETTADRVRKARIDLDLIYLEIDRLNALATNIGIDTRSVAQLGAAARETARLEGATAEDKRQLALLEQQAEALEVTLHKMLGETHSDISSQDAYANRQRDQLAEIDAALDRGEIETARRLARRSGAGGTSPAAPADAAERPPAAPAAPAADAERAEPRAEAPAPPAPPAAPPPESAATAPPQAAAPPPESAPAPAAAPLKESAPPAAEQATAPPAATGKTAVAAKRPDAPAAGTQERKPFVTIRFDRPDVDYARPLYEAVRTAVERHPDVRFDVLSLTPGKEGEGRAEPSRHMRGVLATLSEMGIPPGRIRVSAATEEGLASDEVRIFVR